MQKVGGLDQHVPRSHSGHLHPERLPRYQRREPVINQAPRQVLISGVVTRLADAHTTVPSRTRRDIVIYKVQPGDNVQSIAATFGLNPETILWSNPPIEDLPDLLKVDQEVVILPIDGVYHEVKKGE